MNLTNVMEALKAGTLHARKRGVQILSQDTVLRILQSNGDHQLKNLFDIIGPKTPIDLSVLVDSGIDCEFWTNHVDPAISTLTEINKCSGLYIMKRNRSRYLYCCPRMNHFHVCFVESQTETAAANWLTEHYDCLAFHSGTAHLIKLLKLKDEFCYPWEENE